MITRTPLNGYSNTPWPLLFIAVAACSEPRPAPPPIYTGDHLPPAALQGPPTPGGTLRIAMDAEPPSLNCQLDPLDAWGQKIDLLLMDSLARPHPTTWEHEPRLAERWDISTDHLTFTFHLRRDVRWHDGKPFSADDVIFTFDKLLDAKSKTAAKRSYLEPLAAYEKLDTHTVRFTLKRPYWLAFDAIAEIFIYPKHVYARGNFNSHPANRAPIGTGPFVFAHWRTGDEIKVLRNETYYGGKAHLDAIVFKYVPDPNLRSQMLLRGDVDVVERLSPDEWKRLTQDAGLGARFWRLRHVPSGLQWIGWNVVRPVFADPRVRRALTMLIDRGDIVTNLRLGLDAPAVSWFYPGAKEYEEDLKPWPYDPRAAQTLLDEAGWRDSDGDGVRDKNGVRLTFTFLHPTTNVFYDQLASLLKEDLKRAGIAMTAARSEWAVYTERLRKHDFDACSLIWTIEPRNDPFQVWHSSAIAGGSNFISYQNAEVDQLLERARGEFDDGRRAALYHQFNRILHQEQPYTFLFKRYNLSMVAKDVGGIVSTPYGIFHYAGFFKRSAAP